MRGPRPAPYLLYQRRRRGIRGRAPATRGPDGRARTPESPGPEPHAEVPARCASTGRRTVPHRGGDRWEVVENGLPPRKNPSSTRVLPARAGMVPHSCGVGVPGLGAPRTRGDGPNPPPPPPPPPECSPHARGWSPGGGALPVGLAVLPARAGFLLRSDAEVVGAADHGSVGLPLLVDDQDGGG